MNERSNLTDFQIYSTETKSELANLVDRQLEARGVCGYAFDEKEVNRTWERELLGPKFYYHRMESFRAAECSGLEERKPDLICLLRPVL